MLQFNIILIESYLILQFHYYYYIANGGPSC